MRHPSILLGGEQSLAGTWIPFARSKLRQMDKTNIPWNTQRYQPAPGVDVTIYAGTNNKFPRVVINAGGRELITPIPCYEAVFTSDNGSGTQVPTSMRTTTFDYYSNTARATDQHGRFTGVNVGTGRSYNYIDHIEYCGGGWFCQTMRALQAEIEEFYPLGLPPGLSGSVWKPVLFNVFSGEIINGPIWSTNIVVPTASWYLYYTRPMYMGRGTRPDGSSFIKIGYWQHNEPSSFYSGGPSSTIKLIPESVGGFITNRRGHPPHPDSRVRLLVWDSDTTDWNVFPVQDPGLINGTWAPKNVIYLGGDRYTFVSFRSRTPTSFPGNRTVWQSGWITNDAGDTWEESNALPPPGATTTLVSTNNDGFDHEIPMHDEVFFTTPEIGIFTWSGAGLIDAPPPLVTPTSPPHVNPKPTIWYPDRVELSSGTPLGGTTGAVNDPLDLFNPLTAIFSFTVPRITVLGPGIAIATMVDRTGGILELTTGKNMTFLRTDDYGESWQRVSNFPAPTFTPVTNTFNHIEFLDIIPTNNFPVSNANTALLTIPITVDGEIRLFVSPNGGFTWPTSLAVDGSDPRFESELAGLGDINPGVFASYMANLSGGPNLNFPGIGV